MSSLSGETAPCGHPLALYEYADGSMRPIRVLAAIWCNQGCGWVKEPDVIEEVPRG